ncbi:hypothetical protein [Serratia marcescens]|uniref:hypothetical protein n=1 Tax=Serratia marcescens TaxID=615 RepID=UPI003FA79D71
MSESSKPSLNSTSASMDPGANALPGREEVKGKFSAGAVPLEANYAAHIDATYTALAAVGLDPDSPDTGHGLQVNTATNKLEVNTATIQARLTATDGVQLNSNTLSAKLHTASTNHIAGVIRADSTGLYIDTGNASTRKGLLAQPAGTSGNDANRSVLGLALNTSHCLLDNSGYLGINTANVQLKLSAAKPLTLSGTTMGLGLNSYGALHSDAAYANILALKPTTASALTLYANTHHFTLNTGHSVPTLQINTANIQPKLTNGTGISITGNTVAVNTTVIQPKLTAGTGITVNSSNNNIAVNTTVIQPKLTAGTGITINSSNNNIAVNTTVIQPKLTNGTGISITGNTVAVNTTVIQPKLTNGTGISITGNTVAVNTTLIQPKLTKGEGITLSGNTISTERNATLAVKMLAAEHGATHYAINNFYIALLRYRGQDSGFALWQIYLMARINNSGNLISSIPSLSDNYSKSNIKIDGHENADVTQYRTNRMSVILNFMLPTSYTDLANKPLSVLIQFYNAGSWGTYDSTIYKV